MIFMGIWVFAFGFALKFVGVPQVNSSFSIPLIILGILLIIVSNFFKKNKEGKN